MKRYIFAWVVAILIYVPLPNINLYKFDTICCLTYGWAFGYMIFDDVKRLWRYIVRKYRKGRSK